MSSEPSSPSLLDQLIDSFMERQRRGERPSIDEYLQKYPELADEIRDVFPALNVIEEFADTPGVSTGPALPNWADSFPPQLGEYRLLREVGRGGMGVVFEAVQE